MAAVPTRVLVLVMTVIVSLVILGQVDVLIGEIVSASGRVHGLSDAIGIAALSDSSEWTDWASATAPAGLFLGIHTAVDVAFYAAYGYLGWRLLAPVAGGRRVLRALIALEITETIALFAAIGGMSSLASADPAIGTAIATAVSVVSLLKWIATAALALTVVIHVAREQVVRDGIRTVLLAVRGQRLSVAVVAIIAVVSLASGSPVLEQLADVERGWASYDGFRWGPVIAAVLAFGVVGASLFVFGRFRAGRYQQTAAGPTQPLPKPDAPFWPWLVAAGVVPVFGALVSLIFLDGSTVDWGVVLVNVVVVAVVIAGGSALLRRLQPAILSSGATRPVTPALAQGVRDLGDLLAGLFVALGALGVIRSFTAPALLALVPGATTERAAATVLPTWIALVLAIAIALVSLAVLRLARNRFDALLARRGGAAADALLADGSPQESPLLRGFGYVVLGLSGAVLLVALVVPAQLAAWLEPVATLVAIIGAWAVVAAALTLLLDDKRPLEVFRLLQMRSTPLLSLLVLAPVVVGQFAGAPALHAIPERAQQDVGERLSLEAAFADWAVDNADCAVEVATANGPVPVVPLVLGAAEGGGIRAAAWTANVYREFLDGGDCFANSVFLSSGVSGGSVGLTLFREDGNPATDPVSTTAANIANPDGLATVVAADLVGDVIGAVTGVRVPTAPGYGTVQDPTDWTWQDRATLMQANWHTAAPQFATPYDLNAQQPTGYLVLNSTDAMSKCKVVISQVDLSPAALTEPDGVTECTSTDAEIAGAIDLQDFYRDCPFDMDWATVAGLSARFPIVSPAGRVTANEDCGREASLQLVDGGYIDNSGLGTLSDLSPALTSIITDHNATLDAGEPYVVPIVMFLSNKAGLDIAPSPNKVAAELAVPLQAVLSAPLKQVAPATWLTRLTAELEAVCPTTSGDCQAAVDGLRETIPQGAVVIAPSTNPAINAPLGWALSDGSRSRLIQELAIQKACTQQSCPTQSDYARFGDLLGLLSSQ
jgi:hypothetical protein